MLIWLNEPGFFQDSLSVVDNKIPSQTIPNDCFNAEASLGRVKFGNGWWGIGSEDFGLAIGGVLFGGCHCLAWNFNFPTPIEQTLWRVCSVSTAVMLPIYYFLGFLLGYFDLSKIEGIGAEGLIKHSIMSAGNVLYILCRLFILAEVVRSLFYLPLDAFVSTSSVNFPILGEKEPEELGKRFLVQSLLNLCA